MGTIVFRVLAIRGAKKTSVSNLFYNKTEWVSYTHEGLFIARAI
jgi:hypothetical protein